MPVFELTSYRAAPGTPDKVVIDAVLGARVWMAAQPGFVGHRLLRDKDGLWTDLAEWTDAAAAEASHAAFNPAHPALAPLMAICDLSTLTMRYAEQAA
jgi:hypothetical protein